MRKKSMRLISAALAACMMLSALPMGAFAAEPGDEPENGVSAQTSLPVIENSEIKSADTDQVIDKAGTYTMSGNYANRIIVNTDGDVTIKVTGNIKFTREVAYNRGEIALWHVAKVGTLTIDNSDGFEVSTVPGSYTEVLREDYGAKAIQINVNGGVYKGNKNCTFQFSSNGKVNMNNVTAEGDCNVIRTNGGGDITITNGKYVGTAELPTLMCSGGTTHINDVEATNSGENIAVAVKNAATTVEINKGVYVVENGNAVNVVGGTCTINGGTYRVTGKYACVFNNGSQATATVNIHGGVFEGAGTVISTSRTGTTTIDEKVAKTVIRNIDGEDENVHKTGVSGSATSTTIIDGCTIENSECGVRVGDGTPSVTLKNAEFNNNTNDIYLNANQKITIEDTFTDTATVKCADAAPDRQITTNDTTGQEKLKLISNDLDANGKTYRVAYNQDGNFRYLTPRAENKYTVTAENATATLDGEPLYSYNEIGAGKDVTLTADAPEDGWAFAGWQVTEGGLTLDDTTGTVTFQMPTSDVVVSAQYEYVGTPDAAADNIKGALSAVVVGAAAGAIIYEAGTGIYRVINMPGISMPSNRIELAELLWEHAGKPEPVSTALYSDIDEDDTDAQKAARWAVEQDLMQDNSEKNTFNPHFPVSKLRTCLTWNAAKEKGLFDTDKTAE